MGQALSIEALRALGVPEGELMAISAKEAVGHSALAEREQLARRYGSENPAPAGGAAPDSFLPNEAHAARNASPAAGPDMLPYVLAYAALAWPVLPIKPGDKRPLGGQGIKHATTDEKTIRAWWARWPTAGIALYLAGAGLCAIDIDPRAGTKKTPKDFPATLRARTGGGGWHLIYKAPQGIELPGKLEAGVDLKHEGYVLVAPSLHPSGRRYEWL